jgi:integrase
MDRRRLLDRAIKKYRVQGKRRDLVRIPADVLATLSEGLEDGLRILPTGKIQARYRGADKKEVSRNFDTFVDAQKWRNQGLTNVVKGDWTNPRAGKVTIGDLFPVYLSEKNNIKASSRADIAYLWGTQVDVWANEQVGDIKPVHVAKWVRSLTAEGHSHSVVRRCVQILSGILDVAVEQEAIARNPVNYKVLTKHYPKQSLHAANPLSLDQLDALLTASSDHYRDMTEFLARTGLRMSEVRELRVKDLRLHGQSPAGQNFAKAPIVRVDRACVQVQVFEADGSPVTHVNSRGKTVNVYEEVVDTPKGGQVRSVPLTPRAVQLAKAAAKGKKTDDLLFTSTTGGRVSRRGFATSLSDAATRGAIETESGQAVTPHSLRDTFATQALLSNASVIAVSRALGHRDAVITLQRYAGLLPEDTENLRAGLTASEAAQTRKRTAKKRRN